jgi:6-phosphogluconolactonase
MRKTLLFLLIVVSLKKTYSQEYYLLVGTYDSQASEGVYVYKFNSNTGEASKLSHVKTSNPSFLAVSPNEKFVYAVHEVAPADGKGGDIAAFTFNKQSGQLVFLNRQLSGGDHPR